MGRARSTSLSGYIPAASPNLVFRAAGCLSSFVTGLLGAEEGTHVLGFTFPSPRLTLDFDKGVF
jgi:hypothetical protein